ncbi:Transcriptional regulator, GntR family domain [Brevibacillus laterosporus]|nr:hypothetical protein [Brevibacillus laterosporus]RAP27913.1 Transcriptional regulator, GntR family domain [Brevibacillus laterosporus]
MKKKVKPSVLMGLGEWKPRRDDPVPLYRQIVAYLREKISVGEWPVAGTGCKKNPSLGYEEPKGLYKLRMEVRRHLANKGIEVKPSCILIVSGALQGLQLISMGLMQPGAIMLMEKPSYLYSLNLLPSAGIRMQGIKMDEEGISQRALLAGIQQQTTIPTFQNPSGKELGQVPYHNGPCTSGWQAGCTNNIYFMSESNCDREETIC